VPSNSKLQSLINKYNIIDSFLSKIGPRIALFTIHESIITTQGNEGLIEAVMAQELNHWIGHNLF
jgi:hypothetical protein